MILIQIPLINYMNIKQYKSANTFLFIAVRYNFLDQKRQSAESIKEFSTNCLYSFRQKKSYIHRQKYKFYRTAILVFIASKLIFYATNWETIRTVS